MILGLIGLSGSVGYLVYMNYNYDRSKYYVATQEDGTEVLQKKISRWDT